MRRRSRRRRRFRPRTGPPLDAIAVAGLWAGLMGVLGYARFGAAGVDIGSHVSRYHEVPSGFSLFPGDIVRPPRAWLERTANVVRVTEPARGGHFAPFEEPELYAEELRAFFRPYRAAPPFDPTVPIPPAARRGSYSARISCGTTEHPSVLQLGESPATRRLRPSRPAPTRCVRRWPDWRWRPATARCGRA